MFPVKSNLSSAGSHLKDSTKEKDWDSESYPTISLTLTARRPSLPVGSRTAIWITTQLRLSMYIFGMFIGWPVRRWMSFWMLDAWNVAMTACPVCIAWNATAPSSPRISPMMISFGR